METLDFVLARIDDRNISFEPYWPPLETFTRICREHPHLPDLDDDKFMHMHSETIDGRRIHAYKHIDTRRYLWLDDAGHAIDGDGSDHRNAFDPVAHVLRMDEPRTPEAHEALALDRMLIEAETNSQGASP
jgi:hypothetical protein